MKALNALFLSVPLVCGLSVKAQESGYGITAGINMSYLSIEGRHSLSEKSLIAPTLAFSAHGKLHGDFGLFSEVSFGLGGSKITDSAQVSGTWTTIENPFKFLYNRYLIAPTYTIRDNYFLLAGLSIEFDMAVSRPEPYLENIAYGELDSERRIFNAGLALGAGYTYLNFRFDVRYHSSFMDVSQFQDAPSISSAKANSVGLYITYIFDSAPSR